jgi:hypothetical protein
VKLSPIILQLRSASTSFGNNIAGAAELAAAEKETYSVDRAFVVQLAENATPNDQDIGINQVINETFAVVVGLNNTTDHRGQTAHDRLFDIRAEIFSAILGWIVPGSEATIAYSAGRLLDMNRAYFWYQFEFTVPIRITDADGYTATRDDFLHANVKHDMKDDETRTDAEDDVYLPGPP